MLLFFSNREIVVAFKIFKYMKRMFQLCLSNRLKGALALMAFYTCTFQKHELNIENDLLGFNKCKFDYLQNM